MLDGNFVHTTSDELREIALIVEAINSLSEELLERIPGGSGVSFGNLPLFDLNADPIGQVVWDDGVYVYSSETNGEATNAEA